MIEPRHKMITVVRQCDLLEIFNTDQGVQFTSTEFVGILETENIRISMDGRGRLNMRRFIFTNTRRFPMSGEAWRDTSISTTQNVSTRPWIIGHQWLGQAG